MNRELIDRVNEARRAVGDLVDLVQTEIECQMIEAEKAPDSAQILDRLSRLQDELDDRDGEANAAISRIQRLYRLVEGVAK